MRDVGDMTRVETGRKLTVIYVQMTPAIYV